VWVWVASLIARMAADGEVPPMGSPTYNALITTSKGNAMGAIRKAKNCLNIQMPFPYAHMLATLVHINNYVLATICGIQMGSAIGQVHHVFVFGACPLLGPDQERIPDAYTAA